MLMCHKVKNTLRTCAPALYGCGNDPVTCVNNKASGLKITVTSGVPIDGTVVYGTVSAPTTLSPTPADDLTPHFSVPLGWGCREHGIPDDPSAIDKDYLRALHRFCFLMGQRFSEKEALGWEGWDVPTFRQTMVNSATAKLKALAAGDDPEKDAADLANFALFLWNMSRPRGGEAVG